MELIKTVKTETVVKTYKYKEFEVTSTEIDGVLKSNGYKLVDKPGKLPPEVAKNCYPCFVKPEFFESIKKQNPFTSRDDSWSKHSVDTQTLSLPEAAQLIDNAKYVILYSAGYILYDSEGNPIPVPLHVSYIGTYFTNQNLKLRPALDVLRKHPWVLNPEDLEIAHIPSYNAERDRDRFIAFDFLADETSFREAHNALLAEGCQYFGHTQLLGRLIGQDVSKKDYFGLHHLRKFDDDDDV